MPAYRYAGHVWDDGDWEPLLCAQGGKPFAPGVADIRGWLAKEADPEQRAEYERALAEKPRREPTAAERRHGRRVMEPVDGDHDVDQDHNGEEG